MHRKIDMMLVDRLRNIINNNLWKIRSRRFPKPVFTINSLVSHNMAEGQGQNEEEISTALVVKIKLKR